MLRGIAISLPYKEPLGTQEIVENIESVGGQGQGWEERWVNEAGLKINRIYMLLLKF